MSPSSACTRAIYVCTWLTPDSARVMAQFDACQINKRPSISGEGEKRPIEPPLPGVQNRDSNTGHSTMDFFLEGFTEMAHNESA